MAIIRWDPSTDVQTIRSDFEHMMREMNRMFGKALPLNTMGNQQTTNEVCPAINVYQTNNQIMIECELPGLEQKDVEVTSTQESITIKGTFKRREDIDDQDVLLDERAFGKFTRILKFPANINFEQTHASFKNGLLTVTAPVAEESQKKPCKIQIEG